MAQKLFTRRAAAWLVYDGNRWRPDDVGHVIELAKQAARLIADEFAYLQTDDARAERSAFAQQSLNKGSLDKMLDLAKSLLAVEEPDLMLMHGCSTSRTAPLIGGPVVAISTISGIC